MTGASGVLDPVEAAKDDISRSKRLIASTLDDLTQHHSWLESYHRDERRRAQRLRREDALRRLELKRQRAAWLSRRLALATYAFARTTTAFLVRNGRAFLTWATPRAHALSRLMMRWISAGASWAWRTGLSLSRTGLEASTAGLAWTIRASDQAGIVFRGQVSAYAALLSAKAAILAAPGLRRASIGWIRTRHRARRIVSTLEARASDGWSKTQSAVSHWIMVESPRLGRGLASKVTAGTTRTRVLAAGLSRAAFKTGTDSWSWAALRVRQAIEKNAATGHRALIVRPSTALVCIEPRRGGLPAVLTS
ncbi:MAG: hypothetical protein ACSLE4_11265 [Methyloceanibacter sp.]|uniref:hypothetical protein n=1 Tax=Methyloceanibacter sp. TaxID=1965321 RepID=UPI003EDF777A